MNTLIDTNLPGRVEMAMEEITSSKTYQAWQFYCEVRDRLLGRER